MIITRGRQLYANRTPFNIYRVPEETRANLQARTIYRSLTTVEADKPDVRLQTHEA